MNDLANAPVLHDPADAGSELPKGKFFSPLAAKLLELGFLNEKRLESALAEQRRSGRPLGKVLAEGRYLAQEQLAHAFADLSGLPYLDISAMEFSAQLAGFLPERQARRYNAVVLEDRKTSLLVGMLDPTDLRVQDSLALEMKRPLDIVVISAPEFERAMSSVYSHAAKLNEFAKDVEREVDQSDRVIDLSALGRSITDAEAPVVKLLQTIFEDAARLRASDVHLEPQGNRLVVRFRIDGVLHTQIEADSRIASLLMVRLKLMAELDISERRLPQDGRISVSSGAERFDVRLSTMPTQFGESAVLRLLRPDSIRKQLRDLMPEDVAVSMEKVSRAAHGLVLVTGPTGSGKTTTLYAVLEQINHPGIKILTCEDPIEYRILGVNQVQVHERISLDFARVLRSFLRQDPDVILVGEIRDSETAEIALRAAMTGHLVLSTLHTNDTESTPLRLLDMGVPRYIIANSLLAVVSQRLVRLLCPHCAEPEIPSKETSKWLGQFLSKTELKKAKIKRAVGCPKCNGIGFFGRTGVYEILEMNEQLSFALINEDPQHFKDLARSSLAGRRMSNRIFEMVCQGKTTVSEAMVVLSTANPEEIAPAAQTLKVAS
jgi:MSHA biogenesis protein MshE